ncbi:MAG: PorP/SprF family type IX secretion system membrane protein [Saprospiraceae bacterium]|nr:PorP/SprF family type IX secretion system membrane protein [Saprospiraceae bacterium]
MKFTASSCLSYIIAFGISLTLSSPIMAQDPHFSQFYASPLTLNPALAGTSAGNYRVAVNYRDQWRGALDNPLRTFSAAGDLKFFTNDQVNRPDIAAGGFMFFSDQVSDFDLNTNQIAIVGAYHKSLDQNYDHYIGLGIQLGLIQKSINYEDLNFQDEFNSIDGYTLTTSELLPANNFAVLDFAVGLNYSIAPEKGKLYFAGLSYSHFTTPNISFYKLDESPNPNLIRENNFFAKITGYAGMSVKTSELLDIQPRILFLAQGPHTEVNLGTNFKYKLDDFGDKYLHFGPWIRTVNNETGFGVESIVASVGIELNNILFGLSYDHNIGDLISDRKGLNALEISITFLGEVSNNDGFCPTF